MSRFLTPPCTTQAILLLPPDEALLLSLPSLQCLLEMMMMMKGETGRGVKVKSPFMKFFLSVDDWTFISSTRGHYDANPF